MRIINTFDKIPGCFKNSAFSCSSGGNASRRSDKREHFTLYPKSITSEKISSAEHSKAFMIATNLSNRAELLPRSMSDK